MIFITGGYATSSSGNGDISTSEIVDIPDGSFACQDPADLPFATYEGVSLRTSRGNPLVCGGDLYPSLCYEYDRALNSWISGPSLTVGRLGSAYTELPDGSFWILSGNTEIARATSELYMFDSFVAGPSLEGLRTQIYMCAAAINDQYTFVGGELGYLYDWDAGEFMDISAGYDGAGYEGQCGVYTSSDGSKHLVVAGGDRDTESQIFDLDTMAWRTGPALPTAIKLARVLQDGDTFLILGGYNNVVKSMDTIIEFDPATESWISREETLSSPKHFFFSIDVEADLFC